MSRNQNFKSYGRGKHSNHPNTVVHSSIQFDKFFCENSNKPTAAKSAGTIGKWGITSFTSIRSSTFPVGHPKEAGSRFSSLNKKRQQPVQDSGIQNKRPVLNNNIKRDRSPVLQRKFFKSRNAADASNQKSYKTSNSVEGGGKKSKHLKSDENKKQKHSVLLEENKSKGVSVTRGLDKPIKISTKKITSPVLTEEEIPLPEDYTGLQTLPSPPKERDKPPIVLRIFKGTSQIISKEKDEDDDEEEVADDEDNQNMCPILRDPSPEPALPIAPPPPKPAKRRSPEKVRSPSPDPAVAAPPPAKLSRRNSEKASSPEPAPAPTTRTLRHRSPEPKTKPLSPEHQPTITTRSLRRRVTPASEPVAQPHTSPKRSLRSSRNTAPAAATVVAAAATAAAAAPGKLVITNLNSDHPTVYTLSEDVSTAAVVPPLTLTSPQRKDSKEHKSYSNKHRKAKNDNAAVATATASAAVAPKPDSESAVDSKVEQLLADLGNPAEEQSTAQEKAVNDVKPAVSLDTDRDELLHLLEDDEEEETAKPSPGLQNAAEANVAESVSEIREEVESGTERNATGELKIKIKISDIAKSAAEEPTPAAAQEPEPEPASTTTTETDESTLPSTSDSVDSGIEVKADSETAITFEEGASGSQSTDQMYDLKDSYDSVDSGPVTSDVGISGADTEFEVKSDKGGVSAIRTAAAANKKASIFKSRNASDGNKKRLALYKHKWADDKDAANNAEDDKGNERILNKEKALDSIFDGEIEDAPLTKFIRKSNTDSFDFDDAGPVTGVKCSKKNKEFYTVVRNVKRAHQIQESGEFQEFNDDVEYILDALQDNNPIGTRCLSAITLATKCTEPAFRMHVRAHGTVTKFFRALHDATKDQSLGLCTATVMFVLSQDRLNMDLDRDSLELMLNLLESDASHTKALEDCGLTDSQLTKNRDRVRQICADIQAQGHAKHLNLDNITVGHLSMETLLSLTSKRAGEWFKEELRELGGLEHIIKTVFECCKHVDDTANAWSATSLEKIRKVDRCLRVLENVTMQNEQNNYYLLDYQSGILIDTLVRMYKVCDYEIPLYPTDTITDKDSTGAVLRECLMANLKVLINITHDYQNKSYGSVIIGSRPGVIESSLHVLLQVPQYIPKEEKFDLMLLTLIMLINLVEHCEPNRKAIVEAQAPSDEESIFDTKTREPAVKALISMFYNHEELARNEEKKTDAILEGENTEKPPNNAPQKSYDEFIEETISMLVQKAGQNMEHTLIAAYVAMLIGYLIIDNEEYEKFVRGYLPEKNFQFMIAVLQKFYSFMTLTASGGTVSNRGMKSVQMVIQKLLASDTKHGIPEKTQSTSESNNNGESSKTSAPLDLNVAGTSNESSSLPNKFCASQSATNVAISAL